MHESNKLTIDFLKGKYGKKLVQLSYEKYQELYTKDKRVGYDLNSDVVYKPLNCSENIKFEGRIIGGCIDVLTQIIGTKYDNTINFCNEYKNDGFIWYFDNAELSSMELYRRLYHIKEVEWLKNVKGILFGRRIADNIYKDFDYNVAIKKALGNLNVPIIYDVDIGHVMPQFTIINGSYATFELFNGKGKLTQELK